MELKKELLEFLEANNNFGLIEGLVEGIVDTYISAYKQGDKPLNEKKKSPQSSVEWFADELKQFGTHIPKIWFEAAKEMEKQQQNNLPIHIHEGISNTQVYIEDGVVHVKPNETFKSK